MARRRVVTERDVARAAREKKSSLDVGDAVVTPAARDEARRVGVTLLKGATEDSGSSASSAQSSASSASDAVEARANRIAVGADHGGVTMKDAIAVRLRELGHEVIDVGTSGTQPVDYPDFAAAVARRVADEKADFGIMVDGAGIGSCMAANKIPGVRAAMCHDVTTAINAREHNDARVLTLGGGLIGARLALVIVETFLATPFAGGRHAARIAKIEALDREGRH